MTTSKEIMALGMTQAQFAEVLGVHAITVSKWERFASPTPYEEALLRAFGRAVRSPDVGIRAIAALSDRGAIFALFVLLRAAFE